MVVGIRSGCHCQKPVKCAFRSALNSLDAYHTLHQQLGLKYVDLYLIHDSDLVKGDFEYAWRQLENIKADGLARYVTCILALVGIFG